MKKVVEEFNKEVSVGRGHQTPSNNNAERNSENHFSPRFATHFGLSRGIKMPIPPRLKNNLPLSRRFGEFSVRREDCGAKKNCGI